MNREKQYLRKQIVRQKGLYPQEQLSEWSSILFRKLEGHPLFKKAHTVLLYHSLPDEVDTRGFIKKWSGTKRIVLPVVKGDQLELRLYAGEECLHRGRFGIEEPAEGIPADEKEIELAIIPGVAFDRDGNRLGRGKGYYDRTLDRLGKAYRIGVCFGFQILGAVPSERDDRPMDEVWTEKGCISKKQYPQ